MIKKYLIYYKGLLAYKALTLKGAQALAYRLAKEKNWDISLIEIRKI